MANDIQLQYTGEEIKDLLDFINNLQSNDSIKITKVTREEAEDKPGTLTLSLQWINLDK